MSVAPTTFCDAQRAARFAPSEPSTAHRTSITLAMLWLCAAARYQTEY